MSMLVLLLAAQAMTPPPDDPNDEEIVVRGERPAIVVRGGRPHCRPLRGDPYDAVAAPRQHPQSVIAPNAQTGALELRRDDDPISGTGVWHRAGTGIGAYVFRAPVDGTPLCIGGDRRSYNFGQLRQQLDARPYRGRMIRFTAWVATSEAQEVRFWLASGTESGVLLGESSHAQPLRGTHRWTPIVATLGPVPRRATKISYGFLLVGDGDAWLARPQLEVIERSAVEQSSQAPALGAVGE